MPYPIGGDFLPNPREGSAMDFLFEKFKEGAGATREAADEFFKKFKAAPTWEAKMALIKALKRERESKRAGHIGQVKISIDLTGDPVTVRFDLQKAIAAGDWEEWECTFRSVTGIVQPSRENDYTVVLALGDYYRDRVGAQYVAVSAAELLHLNVENLDLKGNSGG